MPPRKSGLKAKTRMKAYNSRRSGSRFPKRRDPAYCAWIRTHPCLLADGPPAWIEGQRGCLGPVECAHVRSRGAGGPDVANTVPLCRAHHREQHTIGLRSFEQRYGISLELKALVFAALQPPKCERDLPEVFGPGSAHPGAPTPSPEGA